jgi:hypothetical protein
MVHAEIAIVSCASNKIFGWSPFCTATTLLGATGKGSINAFSAPVQRQLTDNGLLKKRLPSPFLTTNELVCWEKTLERVSSHCRINTNSS